MLYDQVLAAVKQKVAALHWKIKFEIFHKTLKYFIRLNEPTLLYILNTGHHVCLNVFLVHFWYLKYPVIKSVELWCILEIPTHHNASSFAVATPENILRKIGGKSGAKIANPMLIVGDSFLDSSACTHHSFFTKIKYVIIFS